MNEMTLEQVRDQLREWGKVDHSPLCVNCVFWANAIDAALQSRAQGEAVADAVCEIALDAFYGEEDWRKDYAGESFKPISCMRAALEAALAAPAERSIPVSVVREMLTTVAEGITRRYRDELTDRILAEYAGAGK